MTTEPKQATVPDDIDLFLLVERAILFFGKYKWVFTIAAIIGLLLGYYFYRIIPPTYKSRMIVHSFTLANQEEIQIVKNWNELLAKKEYKSLARELNCPEEVLKKLKKIKADEIQQVFSQVNPNGFIIDVLVTANLVLPILEKGIVYGFENNHYIRERLEMKKAGLRDLILKTSAEIKKLDSAKTTLENIIGGRERPSSSIIIDGSSINRQLIEMNEKLLGFKESLEFTRAVQVLQGLEAFHRPAGPKLIPWLIIGLLFSLAVAWLYAFISSIHEGLKARARERQVNSS